MDWNLKYLTSVGILSLVSVLLIVGFVEEVYSIKSEGRGVNQYGSANSKVCGDKLCVETGGITLMPWEKMRKETYQSNCLTSNIYDSCNEIKNSIEKEKNSDITQELNEIKNSVEVNAEEIDSEFTIDKVNVPVTIPLHQGYFRGSAVYYIITDSSDQIHADIISKNQDWRVELAPLLANVPKDLLSKTYIFTNGVEGDGAHGYQGDVFTSTPSQKETYSALTSHIHVTWKDAATPIILVSENEILTAEKQGLLTLRKIDVVLNMPQIIWPEGQMPVKENKTITDKTPFVGGQVLNIDLKNKTVAFIAHKGFDPVGKSIYCIVTDATPVSPAISLGSIYAPKNAELISSNAAADMYHFMNGILDSGPMGFQSSIVSSVPGNENYSPMWKIHAITWKTPKEAFQLTSISDIIDNENKGLISVNLARPMNADHIVNCPIINPFQKE